MGLQAKLINEKAPPPTVYSDFITKMSRSDAYALADKLIIYNELRLKVGSLSITPLSVISNLSLQPTAIERAEQQIPEVTSSIDDLNAALFDLSSKLGIENLECFDSASKTFEQLKGLSEPPVEFDSLREWLVHTQNNSRLLESLQISAEFVDKRYATKDIFIDDCWSEKLSE